MYKSFKDQLTIDNDEWKRSGKVQYTKGGNPRPPSVEVVAQWVKSAQRSGPNEVMERSVAAAGFADDVQSWHISKYDVYGALFQSKWLAGDSSDEDDGREEDACVDKFGELVID